MNAKQRREQNDKEAARSFAFYALRCSGCGHPESAHNLDGDCLDGACSKDGCRCVRFAEVTI